MSSVVSVRAGGRPHCAIDLPRAVVARIALHCMLPPPPHYSLTRIQPYRATAKAWRRTIALSPISPYRGKAFARFYFPERLSPPNFCQRMPRADEFLNVVAHRGGYTPSNAPSGRKAAYPVALAAEIGGQVPGSSKNLSVCTYANDAPRGIYHKRTLLSGIGRYGSNRRNLQFL